MQSFADPPSVRRVDLAAGSTETLCAQSTTVDVDLTTSQEWFESPDGTRVPAFVVRRADVAPDGDNPALLTGYGGFRVNRTPTFDRFRLPFLAAGGVFVLATLRGGTEYGEPWHEAGRRGNKQRVFDDALAVADGLAERGWADPDRIGVTGGSNGGLLVGALITQRPERFAAALCHVPLLDMLRFHRFLLGASWTTEYGHPEDPEAFASLRDYSPYHNAPEAAYPATMFTTALGDTRVHPSHARKMIALVQDLHTGTEPVILRVEDDAGHGVGKPTSMVVREQSERWGFVFDRLGMTTPE
ncbi:prolyl oligopeptidase family serine peptidase [Halobaculum litoreum]|uniref:prolyl oligopeptidase family serine peptidase n=1 Tax=Halobaculum litoreum TaxID=3031998 RepID=UPI0024C3F2BE|nr:prolyl oligopeptidase family serine peptidase [Halobaculum sp. DT92]